MPSLAEGFRWLCLIVVSVLGLFGFWHTSIVTMDWSLPFVKRDTARNHGNTSHSPVNINSLHPVTNTPDITSVVFNKSENIFGNTTRKRSYSPVNISGLYPTTDINGSQFAIFNTDIPEYIKKGQKRDANVTKTILFWSTWYTQKIWWGMGDQLGSKAFDYPHCYHKNCVLTADKSKLKEADLLLFYYGDRPNFPSERYPHQHYGHFIHESPCGRPGKRTLVDKFQKHLILTLNYRYDSDVYLPYNAIVRKSGIKENMKYSLKYPLSKRSKSVVWPVSHCKASSMRDDYARELNKYIPVDIYGGCGKMRCPRSKSKHCLGDWEENYKFYLAFENNICKDYITEKMFVPLTRELIPVVLGGGNYTRDAPPHSVIDVRDFASPRDLADYLHYLSENEEEFNKYFQWKPYYGIVPMTRWSFCRFCDALHEGTLNNLGVTGDGYRRWFFGVNGSYVCDNNLVRRMRRDGGW